MYYILEIDLLSFRKNNVYHITEKQKVNDCEFLWESDMWTG